MAGLMSGARGIVIVAVVVGTAAYVMTSPPSPTPGEAKAVAPAATSPAPVAKPTPAEGAAANATTASPSDKDNAESASGSKWTYEDQKDDMRGITRHFAMLDSENTLNFGFPYGESNGRITLRRKGKSVDVMLQMTGGQFVCNSFNDDTVTVKFDDGPIKHFGCAESADGDTKTIFLLSTSRFIKGLKGSRRARIEADFFQAGLQQLTFNTAGLKW